MLPKPNGTATRMREQGVVCRGSARRLPSVGSRASSVERCASKRRTPGAGLKQLRLRRAQSQGCYDVAAVFLQRRRQTGAGQRCTRPISKLGVDPPTIRGQSDTAPKTCCHQWGRPRFFLTKRPKETGRCRISRIRILPPGLCDRSPGWKTARVFIRARPSPLLSVSRVWSISVQTREGTYAIQSKVAMGQD